MTQPSLYTKLTHLSFTPNETFASPAEPLMPFSTTPVGPLVGNNAPKLSLTGHLVAGTTTLAEPLTSFHTTPTEPPTSTYDYNGAMLFTVATVCVYGLSIVFFIAGHTQKRLMNKDEERQISSYLKRMHLDRSSKDIQKFHVIRLKSELLVASAFGQRHDRRTSLLHKPLGRAYRPGLDIPEFRRHNFFLELEEEKEEGEEEDSGPGRALLNRECKVQRVSENLGSSAVPSIPYRGRRFGCVGLGIVDSAPDASSGEEPRDSQTTEGLIARHPHFFTRLLPSIEEDEISVQSQGGRSSPQCQDSPETQSQILEDPQVDSSPEGLSSPDSPSGIPPTAEPFSESTGEYILQDIAGPQLSIEERVQNGSCESVMDTRL